MPSPYTSNTRMLLTEEIEKEINSRFTRTTDQKYIPNEPGRQEYRKCGVKHEKLQLNLEEVLYEILSFGVELEKVQEYAVTMGYAHFLTYKEIRKNGWILIYDPPNRDSLRYLYKLYRPDKNFHRDKAESIGYLAIVSPLDEFTAEFFEHTNGAPIVFALSDGDSFVLIESVGFSSASSLLCGYTSSPRAQ